MAFPGPTPPYNNLPIDIFNYQPRNFVISNVTLGLQTIVKTQVAGDFVIGQLVRLLIPKPFGCYQLNNLTAYIENIIDAFTYVLNLDSSLNVNQFISATAKNKPQIIPIGDTNSGFINANGPMFTTTYIPGSFLNIS